MAPSTTARLIEARDLTWGSEEPYVPGSGPPAIFATADTVRELQIVGEVTENGCVLFITHASVGGGNAYRRTVQAPTREAAETELIRVLRQDLWVLVRGA